MVTLQEDVPEALADRTNTCEREWSDAENQKARLSAMNLQACAFPPLEKMEAKIFHRCLVRILPA